MTLPLTLLVPLLLPAPSAPPVPAFPAQGGPLASDDGGALDDAARSALVTHLADLVEARYCLPDPAKEIADHLRSELAAGSFDDCATRAALAGELTGALRAVNGDKHFRVILLPPGRIEEQEEDPLAAWARRREELREGNSGFVRVEILPGNVGVLQLDQFAPIATARGPAVGAMGFLAGVDALVVDVRHNGGGDPATVQLLCSYFFGERTHLNDLVYRLPEGGEQVESFWTLDEVPGRRLADVPLFVVPSSYTGSAAEEFTYNLKTQERAQIVGETTGGAANPGQVFPLDDRLQAFISTGRARNPITGTNWEGVGVEPDVAVPAGKALDRAVELARAAAAEYRSFRLQERDDVLSGVHAALDRAGDLAGAGKADEALAALRRPLRDAIGRGVLDEASIDQLGRGAAGGDEVDRGLALLRFNAEAYPDSAGAQDGLGFGWRAKGDTARALAAYRHALELDPDLASARRAVDELSGGATSGD